jgi:hypothetical protein
MKWGRPLGKLHGFHSEGFGDTAQGKWFPEQ